MRRRKTGNVINSSAYCLSSEENAVFIFFFFFTGNQCEAWRTQEQTGSGIRRKQSPKSTTNQVARNNERVQ